MMNWRCGLIVLLLVALSVPAGAGSLAEAHKLLGRGDWAAAEALLLVETVDQPENADAYALLGISQYHHGRHADAHEAFSRALALGSSYDSRALYYLGLIDAEFGRTEQSEERFSELLDRFPLSEEALKIYAAAVAPVEPAEDRRRLDFRNAVLSVEAGIDSNPGLSRDGDADLVMAAYGSTRLPLQRFPAEVGIAGYLEKYADQTDNDFLDLALDISRAWGLEENQTVEVSSALSHSWSGFDAFERSLGFLSDWEAQWDGGWLTHVRGHVDFVQAADRETSDGVRTGVRVRGYRALPDAGLVRRVRLQAALLNDDREQDFEGYGSSLIGVECRFGVAEAVTVDLGLDYESRDYGASDPAFGRTRRDDTVDIRAFAMRPIDAGRFLTMQIVQTTRSSTVGLYDASEFLVTAGLLMFL